MITTDKVIQYAQRYDLKYEQALDILQKEEEDEQKKEQAIEAAEDWGKF